MQCNSGIVATIMDVVLGIHLKTESCVSSVSFNHLEDYQMDEIMKAIKSVSYKKARLFIVQVINQIHLHCKTWRIKLHRLSESGKEQIVRI